MRDPTKTATTAYCSSKLGALVVQNQNLALQNILADRRKQFHKFIKLKMLQIWLSLTLSSLCFRQNDNEP